MLDLISPELPEDQPRAPRLTPVEKAQQAWGWLEQFVKDAGEFAGGTSSAWYVPTTLWSTCPGWKGDIPRRLVRKRQITFVSACSICRRQ